MKGKENLTIGYQQPTQTEVRADLDAITFASNLNERDQEIIGRHRMPAQIAGACNAKDIAMMMKDHGRSTQS